MLSMSHEIALILQPVLDIYPEKRTDGLRIESSIGKTPLIW